MREITIEPGATVQLWSKETPIIPEDGYNTYINNTGETSVVAIYQWKPPFGRVWKEVRSQEFLPGEDGVFDDNGQPFYHQRVVVENESTSKSGRIKCDYPVSAKESSGCV